MAQRQPQAGSPPDTDRPRFRGGVALVRLASWNVLDQVLSALTNAVLSIVVARSVPGDEFGAFAVSFLVFSVSIGVMRALVGQPMGIRYSAAEGAHLRSGISRALGTALTVALVGAAACISAGQLLDSVLTAALTTTGLMLPALLLQDSCRLIFFARSRADRAAANDALWAVLEFTAIGIVVAAGRATAPLLISIWGGAAAICVCVALFQLRALPAPLGTRSWLREHRDLWGYLLPEYLLGAGAFTGGILVVGALVGGSKGLAIVAAFRAAQVVLGPLGILAVSLQTFSLPQLSRRTEMSTRTRWRVAGGIGGLMCVTSLVYGTVLLLLPHSVGTFLFRANWDGARSVLLPLVVGQAAGGVCLGAALVIYSLGLARRTFRIMVIEAPLVFTLMIVGSRFDGAVGAAWGLAIDQLLLIPLWFSTLGSVLRDRDGRGTVADAERADGTAEATVRPDAVPLAAADGPGDSPGPGELLPRLRRSAQPIAPGPS